MGRMANIQKKVNPHSFRHRRCTQMSIQGFNEREMSMHFGWKHGSSMPARYNHESYRAVEAKMFKAVGVSIEVKQELEQLKMTRCKCGAQVSPEESFCSKCKALVNPIAISKADRDDERVMSVKKVLDHGLNDPATKDKLALLLQEIVSRMSN